jgi:adenine-specific DNA-methyltransferase
MDQKDILDVLNKYGEAKLIEIDYLRFKSNSNGESKHKKTIKEQVYVLKSNFSKA